MKKGNFYVYYGFSRRENLTVRGSWHSIEGPIRFRNIYLFSFDKMTHEVKKRSRRVYRELLRKQIDKTPLAYAQAWITVSHFSKQFIVVTTISVWRINDQRFCWSTLQQGNREQRMFYAILTYATLFGLATSQDQSNLPTPGTLKELIASNPELSVFQTAMEVVGTLDLLNDETQSFTVLAPANNAVNTSETFLKYMEGIDETPVRWKGNLQASVNNHVISGVALSNGDIFNSQSTSLQTLNDQIKISQFLGNINGVSIQTTNLVATNGILHIMTGVIEPEFYQHSFADLERQSEYGPDTENPPRVSLQTVTDFVEGRDVWEQEHENGLTQIGCRIRAFNRMGLDYLPETINNAEAGNVILGEFLNETRKQQTIDDLLRYSLLPKAVYNDDLPNQYEELTFPLSDCGHMWITKRDDRLCFNDGCVVATPDKRQFHARNG
jgi:uncharacterized surface protein with fasciclin (FAS1) repeats